jgi:hypothetical protein
MRVLVACSLIACAAAPPKSPAKPSPIAPTTAPQAASGELPARGPIEIIATLSTDPKTTGWLVPGPAQLELGGSSVQATAGAPTLQVDLLEQQGNDARVGVRLDNVRFAVWTSRARLLSVLARDVRIEGDFGGSNGSEVVLRTGVQVRRLAHEESRTKIRYVGAVEVEGWVPDDALTDRGDASRRKGARIPTGRKAVMVTPGTVIRTEPRWIGKQLAVANQSYFLDMVKQLDDGWYEVDYEDSDVRVHGFASTRDPPGRTHRRPPPEPHPPQLSPNATLPDHTCLYLDEEAIGFVVGGKPALVEKGTRANWMLVTIDTTPWGPLQFEARGPDESTLETCGT